jgi:hypothetical protein
VPAGNTRARLACTKTGPGTIPPPESVSHARTQRLVIRSAKVSRRLRGIVVELRTNFGTMHDVEVELKHGRKVLAQKRVARIGTHDHRVVLRLPRNPLRPGRYQVVAKKRARTLAERALIMRATRRARLLASARR